MNKLVFFQQHNVAELDELKHLSEKDINSLAIVLRKDLGEGKLEKANLGGTLNLFLLYRTNGEEYVVKTHINNESLNDLVKHYLIFSKLYEGVCYSRYYRVDAEAPRVYVLSEFLQKALPAGTDEIRELINSYQSFVPGWLKAEAIAGKERTVVIREGYYSYFNRLVTELVFEYLEILQKGGVLSGETYRKAVALLEAASDELCLLPKVHCHGDLSNNNILYKEGQAVVIDWEDSFSGPKLYDLAFWASFYDNQMYLHTADEWLDKEDQPVFWRLYLLIVIKKSLLRFVRKDYLKDKISIENRILFALERST